MQFLKNTSILAILSLVAVACGGTIDSELGGSVSGLTGGTVVLTNSNNGDTVSVSSNTTFTFPTKLPPDTKYNVIVLTNPSGQDCSNITNGSGTISSSGANVDNIQVNCKAGSNVPVPVCVMAIGLTPANSVVLQLLNFSSHPLTVPANQSQALCFNDQLTPGTAFVISVVTQPNNPPQTCRPEYPGGGGTGSVPSTGNASAIVQCTTP
jgi:hypothetical protein